MPRRPGGGGSPRGSIEAGLRELAKEKGPDIRQLSRGDTENLQGIMQSAQTPVDWPEDAKASAVLTVIQELIEEITNPRWKAAAMAAFRLPADQYLGAEYDSLAGRLRALAVRDGASSDVEIKSRAEAYRGFWMSAANSLADMVERRFAELNSTRDGWQTYRTGLPPYPPQSLPISFDQTDVLFRFNGRVGVQSISYRWLVAHAPVDHYEPVGWYYNQPDAPVEILPLANCTIEGPMRDLPQGGRSANLKFSRTLEKGAHYFFAYTTYFHSQQSCRPVIFYEIRGRTTRTLTVRAQFDPKVVPHKCWRFNAEAQNEGWEVPPEGAPELLTIAPNGYVDWTFRDCPRGRKFGLQWQW